MLSKLVLFLQLILLGAHAFSGFKKPFHTNTYTSTSTTSLRAEHTLDGSSIRGDLQPCNNNCLVRVKESAGETVGGIFIPDNAKEKATQGVVLAVGEGRYHPDTGNLMDMVVKVGQSVLYGKYDGVEVEYDGQTHQVIRDDDVLLTFEGKEATVDSVTPTKDNVLVKLPVKEKATVAGLIVSTAKENENDIGMRPDYGEVLKVGNGRQAGNGEVMPPQVKVGDEVRFRNYAGEEVRLGGVDYLVIKCYDILAIM